MIDYYKPLTEWWKDQLTDLTDNGAMKETGVKIEKVEISKRLIDSPVLVVTSQFGYSATQERVMRAQAFQNKDQLSMMSGRKTLEINGNHPVVHDLLQKVKDNKEDESARDIANTLFQTAMVESGYDLRDPSDLVNRVYKLMSKTLGVDPNEPVREIELPEEEEKEEEEVEDVEEVEEVEDVKDEEVKDEEVKEEKEEEDKEGEL
jgi:heat shock protein beta